MSVRSRTTTSKPWFRSWLWGPIMLVILVIASLVLYGLTDKALGAPASPDRQIESTSLAKKACVTDTGLPCSDWAKKKARQFRHDKLGHSTGGHFSKKIKRLIKRWYANHPNAKSTQKVMALKLSGSDDWWKWPFESMACSPIIGAGYKTVCEQGGDDWTVWAGHVQDVTKVMIACGGTAAIGTLKGGGYVGAGKGAATCLWSLWAKKMFFG